MADVKENTNGTKEENVNLDDKGTNIPDAADGNQPPTEPAKTEEPGKVKKFFSKAGAFTKKALPYVGAAVAGAAVTAGAIVVAVCRGANDEEVPALEKDEELIPADDIFDGEAEVIDTAE